MSKRPILKLILTMCFFGFIATVNALVQPVFAQCEKATDDQVVADIYAKINADKGLARQISHINVVSINLAAKLQGWTDNKDDYDNVFDIAMSTSCVRVVNVNSFAATPPPAGSSLRSTSGCATGTKPCGDLCIPEGDKCNIDGFAMSSQSIFHFDLNPEVGLLELISACR